MRLTTEMFLKIPQIELSSVHAWEISTYYWVSHSLGCSHCHGGGSSSARTVFLQTSQHPVCRAPSVSGKSFANFSTFLFIIFHIRYFLYISLINTGSQARYCPHTEHLIVAAECLAEVWVEDSAPPASDHHASPPSPPGTPRCWSWWRPPRCWWMRRTTLCWAGPWGWGWPPPAWSCCLTPSLMLLSC